MAEATALAASSSSFSTFRPASGGRHHAEVRERREASADCGVAVEDIAEAVRLGHLLHLRAGIGDGDEVAARLLRAHGFLHFLEEILLEDVGLQRGAGFAGHHDQRIGQIDLVAGGPDLLRVGGIDDAQLGKAGLLAKGHGQHLGTEAGAAHANQQHRLEVGRLHLRAQRGKGCQVLLLPLDDVDPAQPLFFTVAGP